MAGTDEHVVDLCIVGAGFAGLAAAKVYLQCAPDTNLVVLDANTTLGGTWAKERLYPDLRSNNLIGTFEYPDFPMHGGYGVKEGQHIPGEVLHKYFCDYALTFGVTDRIRFKTKVLSAERLAEERPDRAAWSIVMESQSDADDTGVKSTLLTRQLILATGLTSQVLPSPIKGQQDFTAPIVSQPWLGKGLQEILAHSNGRDSKVTVLGGSKSSYDAVYMLASRGYKINWVIRKSGYGPTWMSNSHVQIGPKRIWLELLTTTRALSWLSPCIWGDEGGHKWIRSFLHGSKIGRWIVNAFFSKVTAETIKQTGLDSHESLKPLIPDESIQWSATNLAILNYPTPIQEYIKSGQVQIHRQDISHLESNSIVLANGKTLSSEAGLVGNTNWSWLPNLNIMPTSLHARMGIASTHFTAEDTAFWASLDDRSDELVLKKLPGLRHTPRRPEDGLVKSGDNGLVKPTSWRLYRFIAPTNLDNTIAFTGYTTNLLGGIRNELVGLWIYAYFNGLLDRKEGDAFAEASLKQRYVFRRFPFGFGNKFPDFVFEQIGYFDVLMKDLGLKCSRKRGGWWERKRRECFEPYSVNDYRSVFDEWLEMERGKKKRVT